MTGVLQILIALAIVLLLLLLAMFIYNRDGIAQAAQQLNKAKRRQEVPVYPGIIDASTAGNASFQSIPFSVNQTGGAEFTYNFWVYKQAEDDVYSNSGFNYSKYNDRLTSIGEKLIANVDENATCDSGLHKNDIILLLKGDKNVREYASLCSSKDGTINKVDVMLKCPLIKFERGTGRLTVEFNTYTHPDAVQEGTSESICVQNTDGLWSTKNRYKFSVTNLNDSVYVGRWFMVTVVIQDTAPEKLYPARNKVRCRIYINGVLKMDKSADGALGEPYNSTSLLRQNRSPLYLFPLLSNNVNNRGTTYTPNNQRKLLMGNVKYYNYAIDEKAIAALFAAKFDVSAATQIVTTGFPASFVEGNVINPAKTA